MPKAEKKIEETTEVVEAPKEEKEAVTATETVAEKPKTTKAGKKSAKSLKEAEALIAKEERKEKIEAGEIDPSEEGKKKGAAPKVRSILERRSKAYRKVYEKIEADKQYELKDALALAIDTSTTKFDATVELHVRLNVDPRQADQNIRSSLVLPHGNGKSVRVAVFAQAEDVKNAKAAGADVAGEADFLDQLKKEELNFDVLIATPQVMAQLGRYAKLLGPKGLMPNPKSGTVTKDVEKAVKEAKAGRVEYRVDPQGNIHLGVGKASFGADKLLDNAQAVITSLRNNKPSSIKGSYIESITVASSMGPGVKVSQ